MSSPDGGGAGEALGITIRLLASYRRYLPDDHDHQAGFTLRVAPSTAAGQILDGLPIPSGERYTFFVNGLHADRARILQEGDVLAVFPAVGGG